MKKLAPIFALAATGAVSISATPAQNQINDSFPPAAVSAPVQLPTQRELIDVEVKRFRQSFAQRVRSNDYSNKWNSCFSTKSAEYDPAKAKMLRANSVRYHNPEAFTDRQPVIVIDPGHGHSTNLARAGYDTGGIHKATGVEEARLVERISFDLKAELEKRLDAIVIMTRGVAGEKNTLPQNISMFKNQKVALQIRAELSSYLAEKFPSSEIIFISTHTNTGNSPGSEIYYYASYRNGSTDSPESKRLAKTINDHYRLRAGAPRQILSNDYAVLRCQKVPSILAELGSLDVDDDRRALKDSKAVAMQLANGVEAYFKDSYRARTIYAEAQRWAKPAPSLILASK